MKIITDYISGGSLIVKGEHIYLILHNSETKYKLHLGKSLFCWLLKHRNIQEDKILALSELLKQEKEEENKLRDDFFS